MVEDYSKYQSYVDYVRSYREATNAATGSKVDSNANVENKNVTTLSSELFKPDEIGVCRKMMTDKLNEMYGKDLAEQYLDDLKHHIIYKHDETHSQLPYCASITLYPFLHDGLAKLGGISSAPKNLEAFCGSFINLVFAVSAQLAGACVAADQKIKIKAPDGKVSIIEAKKLVENFGVDSVFVAHGETWEYRDISSFGYQIYEDGKFVPLNKVMRRPYNSPIYTIKTKGGLVAKVSKDHRFKVLYRGRDIEVKACDLKLYDTVYCSKDYSAIINKDSEDYLEGQFTGIIAGDGNITQDEYFRIDYSEKKAHIIEIVNKYLERNNETPGIQSLGHNCMNYRKCGKSIVEKTRRLFSGNEYSSYRKRVDLADRSLDWCVGFLDGICATDGSYDGKTIRVSLSNKFLIKNIQDVLEMLDIHQSPSFVPAHDCKSDLWSITVPLRIQKYLDQATKHTASIVRFPKKVDPRREVYYYGHEARAQAKTSSKSRVMRVTDGNFKLPIATDVITSIELSNNYDPYVYEVETESHWYNCGGMITHNCATPEFLTYLDHFIRKKYGDGYIDRADVVVDLSLKGRTLDKVITDCFEQVVYSLNQPAAARGYQSVFWNIAYFDKYYFEEIFRDFVFPDGDEPKWKTVSWLQKRFMKWFNAERLRKPLTFPVETVNLLNDGKEFIDKEWADFAAEMYAEGHSFFTYTSSSVDALASCCYTDDTKVIVKINGEACIKSFRELKHYPKAKDGFVVYSDGQWKHGELVELPNRPVYKVELANGMKMKVTDNHRNNCYGGMKPTKELTVGDYIMVASERDPSFIPGNPTVEKIIRGEKVVISDKTEAIKTIVDCIRSGVVVKKDVRAMGSIVLQRYDWSYFVDKDNPDEFIWDDDDNLYLRITGIKQVDYTGNVFCFEMDDKNDDKFTLANGIHNYNCRLRNSIQSNVFSYTLGAGGISTGSKCVITLNINRIVQDAARDGKDLSEAIRAVVKRVHKYLAAYNEMIKDNLNSGLLPLYDAGFIDMKRQYLTVGFNGLVEAAEFLGIDVAVNDDYKEFTNKILKPIYELNQEDRTEELMFNTEYVPSLICGDCAA